MDIHLAHSYMRSDYNGVLEADYAREAYSRLAVEIMKAVNFYNYNNRDRELHDLYICGGEIVAGDILCGQFQYIT